MAAMEEIRRCGRVGAAVTGILTRLKSKKGKLTSELPTCLVELLWQLTWRCWQQTQRGREAKYRGVMYLLSDSGSRW